MAEISAQAVKELRERTGAGMMECKKALQETAGGFDKAIDLLRKQGLAKAEKKSGRVTSQGWIGSYIHSNGRIGVMLEVFCETDFVARNEKFQEFIRDLSMHIAGSPQVLAVRPEELDPAIIARERETFAEQVKDKPEKIREQIVDGKIQKFYADVCLLHQKYVKDDSMTVDEFIKSKIATIGENIMLGRFVRMEFGSQR